MQSTTAVPPFLTDTVPLVSIVVVTYNAPDYVRQCVEDVMTRTHVPFELIVVDNASEKETVDFLKSAKGIRLVLNERNKLWCAGCNDGMRISDPRSKYILLLNSDVRILRDDWVEVMITVMESYPRVAIVGPKRCERRYGPLFGSIDGHCMLVRRAQMAEHGWFDERNYPWSGAPVEYTAAMFAKGWIYKVVHPDDKIIFHHEHKSITTEANQGVIGQARMQGKNVFEDVQREYGIRQYVPLSHRIKPLRHFLERRRFYHARPVGEGARLPDART